MKWNALESEQSSLCRSLSVVGDRWTLLILGQCFLRVRRFTDFCETLGITRAVLTVRLNKLVRLGILRKISVGHFTRKEYILTQKGLDLYPVIMALSRWGDEHMADERGYPTLYRHASCDKVFRAVTVCSECGEELHAQEVHVHPSPGAPSKGGIAHI